MSTNEAARAIVFHERYVCVEALGWSKELPLDRWTACFRSRVQVG